MFNSLSNLIILKRQLEIGEDEAICSSTAIHLVFKQSLNLNIFSGKLVLSSSPYPYSHWCWMLHWSFWCWMAADPVDCGYIIKWPKGLSNVWWETSADQNSPLSQIERWHRAKRCTLPCIGTCLSITVLIIILITMLIITFRDCILNISSESVSCANWVRTPKNQKNWPWKPHFGSLLLRIFLKIH